MAAEVLDEGSRLGILVEPLAELMVRGPSEVRDSIVKLAPTRPPATPRRPGGTGWG
jgi:hypothetical protein